MGPETGKRPETLRPSPDARFYSVPQIAAAAGLTRRAVDYQLSSVPASGHNLTDETGWAFAALPIDLQLLITRRGVLKGHPNGEVYLSCARLPWVPPVPLDQIKSIHLERAARLQRACSAAFEAPDDASPGERERIALEAYRREFGQSISDRQIRRIMQRAIDRDAGAGNLDRMELFLDESAFLGSGRSAGSADKLPGIAAEIEAVLEQFEDRARPTKEEKAIFFDALFHHFEAATAGLGDLPEHRRQAALVKSTLLRVISSSFPIGVISKRPSALPGIFKKKLRRWRNGGRTPQALRDLRPEKSGKFGAKLCPECRQLVIGGAVDVDGDLSQAWRRLQLDRRLCQPCSDNWPFNPRLRKSEVPKRIRADVMPEILAALPSRRGPKHMRLVSPYVRRDWSDLGPGCVAECDDMTPNHVTHGQVEVLAWQSDASGRPYIGRFECLVMVDRRTDYPWAYVIILGDPAAPGTPQRKAHYSAVHVRLLMLHGHDRLGLPHDGYTLENGIWRSRLVEGPEVRHWERNSWLQTETGLRDPRLALQIRHTVPGNPRSKIIERMFLAVQSRMRCQPGFVGFNERADKREVMDDFIRRVKLGKEHPGNQILHIDDFRRTLDAELLAHANEPQNGTRLPGVSPAEAFHSGIDGHPGIKARPLRQVGASARYLLSTHQRSVRVGAQGIMFKVGKTPFCFWGPELEPWQHREILARFNFEEPELLTCQPPTGEPFTVKARTLPSSTATKEQLAEAAAARANWMKRGKVIYDSLPHPFVSNITRDNDQDAETRELGRFHNEEVESFRAEKSAADRKLRKLREKAAVAGVELPSNIRDVDDALDALKSREYYRQRILEKERASGAVQEADQ